MWSMVFPRGRCDIQPMSVRLIFSDVIVLHLAADEEKTSRRFLVFS